MRFISTFCLNLLIASTFILFSCSDKTESFVSDPLSDYIPLQTGKYITYRIDSLVFTNFGRNTEIHKYQVKHVVDAQITDNLGRPSYRIFTYLSDSTGLEGWTPNGSYFITPLSTQIEVTENNLRVIKLHLPLREGFEWKGNSFLPAEPYKTLYEFSNDDDMQNWNFVYETFESLFSYQDQNYADVYTVEQEDDSYNAPVMDVGNYGFRTRSVEKYSRNIGLIYRQYELWEYQPNLSGPSPYNTGFGITMWMIDHN